MNFTATANFNGAKPIINPDDAALLLIDHQSGLIQTVKDISASELRSNVAVLAKVATRLGIPIITTASVPGGPNGPLIAEVGEHAPRAVFVPRKGEINAWDNADFVRTVAATGKFRRACRASSSSCFSASRSPAATRSRVCCKPTTYASRAPRTASTVPGPISCCYPSSR